MTMQAELLKATGLKLKRGEDRAQLHDRLARACDPKSMDDDHWEMLSEDTQEWANDAINSIKAKQEITEFPDYEAPAPKKKKVRRSTVEKDQEAAEVEAGEEPESKVNTDGEGESEGQEADPPASEGKRKIKKKRASKKKASKKADEPKAKAKPTRGRKRKGMEEEGGHVVFRRLCIEHHDKSREEVYALAEKAGVELAKPSLGALFYHTDQTIDMLRDAGFDVPDSRPKNTSV